MCFYRIQTKRVTSWQCSVFLHVMSACVFVRVQLMILVDGAGGEWPVIGHAPWNGCNLADFVMPFFLFIVGMAIPLSLKVPSSCLTLLLYMPCLHQAMSLSTLCLDATTPSVKFEFNTDRGAFFFRRTVVSVFVGITFYCHKHAENS